MKQRRGWMERLADSTDLQGEAHGGVTEYGREKIQVKVRYGYVCICGGCLELARMTAEQLVITGRIDSVSLIRRR